MTKVEEVYKDIVEQKFTWCQVYSEGTLVFRVVDRKDDAITPTECKIRLKNYFDKHPGTFLVKFKIHAKDKPENILHYRGVSVNDYTQGETTIKSHLHMNVSEEDYKKQVKKELLAEMKAEQDKKDLEEMKLDIQRQHDELKTFGGKAMAMLELVFADKFQKMSGNLKGTQQTNDIPKMDQENKESETAELMLHNGAVRPSELTDEERKVVNSSLFIALHSMPPSVFAQFAQKVYKNPEIVNTLKALL